MGVRNIDICLNAARVGRWLVAVFVLLLLAHAGGLLMTYAFDHGHVFGLVPLFNIATEYNVPTFFASSLFMAASGLFLLLSAVTEPAAPDRKLWRVLAALFAFLAVDEFAVIHELLIGPVREGLDSGGLLFFAWIMPYSVAVLALAVWGGPKLWRLGRRFRLLFGLSAAAFLSGAIGVEMLGGRYYEANDETVDLTYRLYQTAEEFLEFTGLILLVYTQLRLLGTRASAASLQLRFTPPTTVHAAQRGADEVPSRLLSGTRG